MAMRPAIVCIRTITPVMLVVLLLNGCGTSRTSVIDTPDTQHLRGWQKPYEIDGKRYTPLLDHSGFTQQGIASWYGDKFHGRLTSNGEVYDMYAMTAAHKTLPMGVFVRVENLANGRTEVVRINDRGPFVAGRIIDLSYTAARKLGVVGRGTAPVSIEALGYKKTDTHGETYFSLPEDIMHGPFGVQLGAFTRQDNAQRLCNRLSQRYAHAAVRRAMVNGTQFYRVRAGRFSTLEAAERGRAQMLEQGFGAGFVVALD